MFMRLCVSLAHISKGIGADSDNKNLDENYKAEQVLTIQGTSWKA